MGDAAHRVSGEHALGPVLRSTRLKLRRFDLRDAPAMTEALNDPVLCYWTPVSPTPFTEEDARAAIGPDDDSTKDPDPTFLAWAVASAGDDRLLGKVSLSDIDTTGTLAYWAHPAARGRGVMTEAVGLVVEYAFEIRAPALAELRAWVAASNHASQVVLKRNGFQYLEEGEDHVLGDGRRAPGHIYHRTPR